MPRMMKNERYDPERGIVRQDDPAPESVADKTQIFLNKNAAPRPQAGQPLRPLAGGNILAANSQNRNEFLTGAVAAAEGTFYGLGSLVTAVPTSIKEGRLTFGHGWEMAGLKTPALRPTVTGAAVSSVVTGVQGQGWSQEAEALKRESPAFMVGSIMGDVAFTLAGGAGVSKVANIARGGRAIKIAAATEKESTYATSAGYKTGVRSTDLIVSKQRISLKNAKKLQEFSKNVTPETIEMAGTESKLTKITERAGRAQETFFEAGQFETSRAAQPYINAVRVSELSKSGAKRIVTNTLGKVPKIGSKLGGTKPLKATVTERAAGIYREPLLALPKEAQQFSKMGIDVTAATKSQRVLTGVQLTGRVKPEYYRQFLGNVPKNVAKDWIEQIGGGPVTPALKISKAEQLFIKGSNTWISAKKAGSKFIASERASLRLVEDLKSPAIQSLAPKVSSSPAITVSMKSLGFEVPETSLKLSSLMSGSPAVFKPVRAAGVNLQSAAKFKDRTSPLEISAQESQSAAVTNLGQLIEPVRTPEQTIRTPVTDFPTPKSSIWSPYLDSSGGLDLGGPVSRGRKKKYYKRGKKTWRTTKAEDLLKILI